LQGPSLPGRLDLPEGDAIAFAVDAHCFTCGKSSVASVRIARALAVLGTGALRFDFTGFGQSRDGFPYITFSDCIADLAAAARTMEQESYPPSILIGHSLGITGLRPVILANLGDGVGHGPGHAPARGRRTGVTSSPWPCESRLNRSRMPQCCRT
jgi:predicted alpha/beta hydrolase